MPEDVQNNAMDLLKNIDDEKIGMLVQPIGKPCWENSAIVLKKIEYPRIKQVIPKLLEWLQDMNWSAAAVHKYPKRQLFLTQYANNFLPQAALTASTIHLWKCFT